MNLDTILFLSVVGALAVLILALLVDYGTSVPEPEVLKKYKRIDE